MKLMSRVLLVAVAMLVLVGSVSAQKARKLPEKAYIESAQIAIVSGDTARYKDATAMLDSLLMHYGPHPEAYYWLNQIMVDFVEKTGGLENKKPYAIKMAAYRDSLHYACGAAEVKDKYKKECKKFTEQVDTAMAKVWREFYSAGFEQYQSIMESRKEITPDMDSVSRAYVMSQVDSNAIKALGNMELCIILDSTDGRAYVMAGTILGQQDKYEESSKWLDRGLRYTSDSAAILMQIAYNEVQQGKYCEATPYFRKYLALQPQDTTTFTNLAISFNNCKQYDSAAAVQREILQLDPANADALFGLGAYYAQMGRWASDSASAYRSQNNEISAKTWSSQRDQHFDSSKTFFRRAWEVDSSNIAAGREYALISLVTSDFKAAAEAYAKLSELEPDQADHWISLGDSYLNLARWADAVTAYERAVAIQPDNKEVWQHLYDLYSTGDTKNAAKAAEAKKNM